ncbi:MAG: hypothetical protein HY291_23175 [Planctomycetes bacterium]|nr:hypothetical protein [Planctomycetota bacterium]
MAQTRKSGAPAGLFGRLRAGLLARLRSTRGFILIIVVGMLAVLVVLGISFAEQGRVDLMGASNSRDIAATDALAEDGFEMAKRILVDDRHVWSASNAGWDTTQGPGWTSRWPYNPYYDQSVSAGGTQTPAGGGGNANGPAPSRDDPMNFLDAWALMTWNEEDKGSNASYAYIFSFDPADVRTKTPQRLPPDQKVLLDTWQRQPLARVRKFRVSNGTAFGILQISITPKDGAINLNDVFQPGTGEEYPGWYEFKELGLFDANKTDYASPDRRTLEYVLGKRCEWANLQPDDSNWTNPPIQSVGNYPSGNCNRDDGVYNYRAFFEPFGRDLSIIAYRQRGWLTNIGNPPPGTANNITVFYNSDRSFPNRYNFEGARYPVWASTMGMSLLKDNGGLGDLCATTFWNRWYPPGRYQVDPRVFDLSRGNTSAVGNRESLFRGFGFDLLNPARGGIVGGSSTYQWNGSNYVGAGAYGHARPHSFQLHFLPAVAQGRFWTDLEANWYFGGAPGYSSAYYGYSPTSGSISSWVPVGSAYDSLGMGSNWMPPTAHLWNSGRWNSGNLSASEITRGYSSDSGTMPAAKPAATYTYPLTRFADDLAIGNAHFLFNDARTSLRAFGIQENWGLFGQDDPKGRFYDAVCINVTNYQVVYGLLTPEKIPSMLERTTVAPHLHWKARLLDGAYKDADQFMRYDPNDPNPQKQPRPYWVRDGLPFPNAVAGNPEVPGPVLYPYGANDPATPWDNLKFKPFHPYTTATGTSPTNDPVLAPVPEVTLPLPAGADPTATYPKFDATKYSTFVGPSFYRYSIHRAYIDQNTLKPAFVPATMVALAGAGKLGPLGKMDYTIPEPLSYPDLDPANANDIRHGSGMQQDDVFPDTWYDLKLAPANESGDALNSSCSPRPDQIWNWPDWFMQRLSFIHAQHDVEPSNFKPGNGANVVTDPVGSHVEGVDGDQIGPKNASGFRKYLGTKPAPQPHPIYGLPNPNYLQLFPGTSTSIHWCDQFHRYFPLVTAYPVDPAMTALIPLGNRTPGIPTAPFEGSKVVDWFDGNAAKTHGMQGVDRMIHPEAPVAKVTDFNSADPFVPNVSKDDAWRITRIGRKYQEIIADEIMDYQMNPWWPNPCAHMGTVANPQVAVPLDRTPYPSATRQYGAVSDLRKAWWSVEEHPGASIQYEVPDYYAYWNRFWVRTAARYDRTIPTGTTVVYDPVNNPSENHGTYPQALQYFGQPITTSPTILSRWRDRLLDFPFNTLEDATGCEWRYISGCANLMYEVNVASTMRNAPARNHPFRNWADFVGFLGHLVYRSPINPNPVTNPANPFNNTQYVPQILANVKASLRDPVKGVNAYRVCHNPANPNVDPRNKNQFFDGSKVSPGIAGPAYADSLKGLGVGGVAFDKCIVARDGWWPISGNYGEYPTAAGPDQYPAMPGAWSNVDEWHRRIDEWRGRDAAGLRIEQNYISERAANDILVSLSNGRIGPIDFDGDGHVTMTRRQEIPGYDPVTDTNPYTPGYPWNNLANGAAGGQQTEYFDQKQNNAKYNTNTDLDYGQLKVGGNQPWQPANKKDIIQGCVTLPIKFRANTFRVTVVVELTDAQYKNVYASRRFARWYSRIPGEPAGGLKVHGPYTGELMQHGTRTMGPVDPEMNFLSTSRP